MSSKGTDIKGVSALTERIIHTTIIHYKILKLRTKSLKGLVNRMDHSNIKKINLILNLMLRNFN